MMTYFFVDVDFNIIIFLSNSLICNTIGLNNITLSDVNYDERDPETIVYVRLDLWLGVIDLNNIKSVIKVNKELMCSMRPKKLLGLVHVRRGEKEMKLFLIDKK